MTSQYNPPNIGPHDESVAAVVESVAADPNCELCYGQGEYFTHADDCWNDDCVLALGIDDCNGRVVECVCCEKQTSATRTPDQSALIAQLVELLGAWVAWHNKATDDDDCTYLNGEAWTDADMLSEQSFTALAAARGEG